MHDEHASAPTCSDDVLLLSRIDSEDLFVVEHSSQIIALLRLDRLWPEATPLVSWAAVVGGHRGEGLLELLWEAAEAHLRSRGYRHVLHSCCSERAWMARRFLDAGMQPAGHLDFPSGSREFFFWKEI
jgi:hypothetical protein